MDISSLLKNQAQYVMEQYKDFEALKRVFEREMSENPDAVYTTAPGVPEGMDAQEEETDADYMKAGFNDAAAEWAAYMEKYACGEMAVSAFPPSLALVESEIDLSDPMYASGKPMGIPYDVWVHGPGAGKLVPTLTWNIGDEG